MDLQRITPGEPFQPSARTWNAFCDAADTILGQPNQRAQQHDKTHRDPRLILARNTTQTTIGQYQPFGIAGPTFPVVQGNAAPTDAIRAAARGQAIDAEPLDFRNHQSRWAVAQEPIRPGAFGWSAISGPTLCEIQADASPDDTDTLAGRLRFVAILPDNTREPNTSAARLAPIGDATVLWRTTGQADHAQPRIALIDLGATSQTALARLTTAITWPTEQNQADVPYATANLLWHSDATGYTQAGLPGFAVRVWFPRVRRDGQNNAVGLPHTTSGTTLAVRWNRQTARWEADDGQPLRARFYLTSSLSQGGSATAKTICFDANGQEYTTAPAETLTVHDAHGIFASIAPDGQNRGPTGEAIFTTDRNRWEIVAMQRPADFIGRLTQSLNRWETSATVALITAFDGWNPFQGDRTTLNVKNPPGGGNQTIGPPTNTAAYWFAGATDDRVLCRFRGTEYYIDSIEPNPANWQTLDVVTRIAVTVNFANQTYSAQYYTRAIKLPPFAQIGEEIERS